MADQSYANRGAFEARRNGNDLYCVGYFTETFFRPRACYGLPTRIPNLCGLRRISAVLPPTRVKSGF